MKLSDIGKANPKEMEFIDPYTDEPTGIFVTVHSMKSKIGRGVMAEAQRKGIEARNDAINLDENGDLTKDFQRSITIETMANLVEDWRGIIGDNEKPIKPSKEAYIKAFQESGELLDAVFLFANELGNFSTKQGQTL